MGSKSDREIARALKRTRHRKVGVKPKKGPFTSYRREFPCIECGSMNTKSDVRGHKCYDCGIMWEDDE